MSGHSTWEHNVAEQSTYLDFVRAMAAIYVCLYHLSVQNVVGNLSFAPPDYFGWFPISYSGAHCSVIIFFVMSGMLVSDSTRRQKPSFAEYLVARGGRIYSVMAPALIFSFAVTAFISTYGRFSNLDLPNTSNSVVRFLINLTFTSQVWSLAATPPLNGPFWSLSYEFFYYMLFGIFSTVKGRHRWILLAALTVIGGPKMLMLAPCWFLGVAVSRFASPTFSSAGVRWWSVIFALTLFLIVIFVGAGVKPPLWASPGNHTLWGFPLFFSWNWQGDYIFAGMVALNLLAQRMIAIAKATRAGPKKVWLKSSNWVKSAAALLANCSFTLYLFHHPLFFLYSSPNSYQQDNYRHATTVLILTLCTVPIIASLTEWRVRQWRSAVRIVIQRISALTVQKHT